jgi:hypothetical protein
VARLLKWLVLGMGVACVAIGFLHLVTGMNSVPGESSAGATVDSRERFYGAIFLGFGLAWIWVARQSPIPANAVRWLAGIFLLGGIGRIISLAVYGQPQWFQSVLTVIELGLPPVYFWLADADEKATRGVPGSDGERNPSGSRATPA